MNRTVIIVIAVVVVLIIAGGVALHKRQKSQQQPNGNTGPDTPPAPGTTASAAPITDEDRQRFQIADDYRRQKGQTWAERAENIAANVHHGWLADPELKKYWEQYRAADKATTAQKVLAMAQRLKLA